MSLPFLWCVAAGGAIGALLRYISGLLITPWVAQLLTVYSPKLALAAFPFATLFVNLAGSFLIGCAAALFGKYPLDPALRLFLITGILGGFTTFSSFGLETLILIQQQQITLAFVYVLTSVCLGLALVFVGWSIFQP